MSDLTFQFSASSLNLFMECPRCFWLDKIKGIKRPKDHKFPSLPNGMDRAIKKLYDEHRRDGELPAELKLVVPLGTRLVSDCELVHKWQDWRTGLSYESKQGVKIISALDDCLESEDSVFSPLDYKTRGSAPKEVVDSQRYYGLQLSAYSFLLKESGRKVTGKGYLVYYYPAKVHSDNRVEFSVKVLELNADPKYAVDVIKKAVDVLKNKMPPEAGDGCEFCHFREGT